MIVLWLTVNHIETLNYYQISPRKGKDIGKQTPGLNQHRVAVNCKWSAGLCRRRIPKQTCPQKVQRLSPRSKLLWPPPSPYLGDRPATHTSGMHGPIHQSSMSTQNQKILSNNWAKFPWHSQYQGYLALKIQSVVNWRCQKKHPPLPLLLTAGPPAIA